MNWYWYDLGCGLLLVSAVAAAIKLCVDCRQILRGRRPWSCGYCGYSTVGLPTDICPECGKSWTSCPPLARRAWRAIGLVCVALAWCTTVGYLGALSQRSLQRIQVAWDYEFRLQLIGGADNGTVVVCINEEHDRPRGFTGIVRAQRAYIGLRGAESNVPRLAVSLPDLRMPDGRRADEAAVVDWWRSHISEEISNDTRTELTVLYDFLKMNRHQFPHTSWPFSREWTIQGGGSVKTRAIDTPASFLAIVLIAPLWFFGIQWLGRLFRRGVS